MAAIRTSEEDLYRELQQHLDRMPVAFPATESGVELRILRRLFSPQEARVALCLSALPEPVSKVHRRLKHEMSLEALAEALAQMAERGLIHCIGTGPQARYGKAPLVVGIYEYQVNRLTPELERDFLQYNDEALGKSLHSQPTRQMRTAPVNVDIVPERGVARYDDIREVVRSSPGPFAAMNCICRQGKELIGEPCRQTSVRENCLMLETAAQAMAARGAARFVTREEMLEKLDQADREGLVLEPQNTQNPTFVCCCCGCCCGVLTTAKKLPCPAEFFSSTYFAEVDGELCQECGACAPRCQMDAIVADGAPTRVLLSHCIGCGLCVSTCPSGALSLRAKPEPSTPPKSVAALYAKMYRERFGPWGMAKAAGRGLLGFKV